MKIEKFKFTFFCYVPTRLCLDINCHAFSKTRTIKVFSVQLQTNFSQEKTDVQFARTFSANFNTNFS